MAASCDERNPPSYRETTAARRTGALMPNAVGRHARERASANRIADTRSRAMLHR
ncbi:TPA: hypothetical protein QDC32_002404 [Burkholderia stabilis]|nr:hypothetical protein [Burkholderia stabilis]